MCQLCNGTHIIHEVSSYFIRTSCCPECGPESDENWYAGINRILEAIAKKGKEEGAFEHTGNQTQL